jgi:hypothetical protein
MKHISTLAAAASLAALLALPVRFEISGTVLLAAGLAALLHHDYRTPRRLNLPLRRRPASRAAFRAPALRLHAEPHRLAA